MLLLPSSSPESAQDAFEPVGVAAGRVDAGEHRQIRELDDAAAGKRPSSVSSGSPSHLPIATLAVAISALSTCSHRRLPRALASARPGSAIGDRLRANRSCCNGMSARLL